MSIIWGHMPIRYLGLARLKTEGETLAISLSSLRDELLPGLQNAVGGGIRIDSYVEFGSDHLVIMARWGDNRKKLKISRYEIEDRKDISAKLRDFVESVMCGSKGSTPTVSQRQATELAMYQQLAEQQSGISPYNQGLADSFAALKRQVIGDNLYKGELGPIPEKVVPEITARELTKEELKERVARKLDLTEAHAIDPVELVSVGRWRQVMDEVFKDEPKGEDDGKAQEDGTVSGRGSDGGEDG